MSLDDEVRECPLRDKCHSSDYGVFCPDDILDCNTYVRMKVPVYRFDQYFKFSEREIEGWS